MQVFNTIAECSLDGWPSRLKRTPDRIKYIIIHRNTVARTGVGVANWFHNKDLKGVGPRMPYHFFIGKDGRVEQCVKLCYRTNAAAGFNTAGIQIALDGDFRKHQPTTAQLRALAGLCVRLKQQYPTATLAGHTELSKSKVWPNKVCPGKHLEVDQLRLLFGLEGDIE